MLEGLQSLSYAQLGPERVRVQAELAKRSLWDFMAQGWDVLEPGNPFVDNWHIHTIAEHLEAVEAGQLRRLIVNIAPRHSKSLLFSVFFPAWCWVRRPETRFLFTCYGQSLAVRDSLRTRWLIESLWYQERWSGVFALSGEQADKIRFENDKRGYRLATSVTGAITGEGGDMLVLDDPQNALDAQSELERQKVFDFVDRSWSSRVNNPKTVCKMVIQQRLHPTDITDYLLKKEAGWEHLVLPTEHVPTTRVFFNGKSDPRKEPGELLWPERFGPTEIKEAKLDLGEYGYAAQHQQDPRAFSGGMFDIKVLRENEVKGPPRYALRGRFWDLASTTKKTSKRTSGALLGKTPEKHYYIYHMKVGKWRPDERNAILTNCAKHDKVSKIGIEHEGGSSGEDQEVAHIKLLEGYPVEFIKVTGDKAVRADGFAAACNQGLVHVVNDGTWNVELLYEELQSFPTGDYMDQTDSLSLGYNWLARKTVVEEGPKDPPKPIRSWTDELPGQSGWHEQAIPSIGGD